MRRNIIGGWIFSDIHYYITDLKQPEQRNPVKFTSTKHKQYLQIIKAMMLGCQEWADDKNILQLVISKRYIQRVKQSFKLEVYNLQEVSVQQKKKISELTSREQHINSKQQLCQSRAITQRLINLFKDQKRISCQFWHPYSCVHVSKQFTLTLRSYTYQWPMYLLQQQESNSSTPRFLINSYFIPTPSIPKPLQLY